MVFGLRFLFGRRTARIGADRSRIVDGTNTPSLPGLAPRSLRSRRGSVSLTFAISLPALALFTGTAIEYARLTSLKVQAQNALDAAVLAEASRLPGEMTPEAARAMFSSNLPSSGLSVDDFQISRSAQGTVEAEADLTIDAFFGGVIGQNTMTATVRARAQAPLGLRASSVTLRTVAAKGTWRKEIYLLTYSNARTISSRTVVLRYRTPGFPQHSPPLNSRFTIALPPEHSFRIEMVAYSNTGQVISSVWPNPASRAFVRVTGSCDAPGGSTMSWEDGANASFDDFVNTLECTDFQNGSTVAYLLR